MFYMAVTPDKYELPIAVANSVDELALMLKMKKATILSAISRKQKGKNSGIRFIRIKEYIVD